MSTQVACGSHRPPPPAHPDPVSRAADCARGAAAVFWKLLPHGLTTGDPVAGEVFPLITPAPPPPR